MKRSLLIWLVFLFFSFQVFSPPVLAATQKTQVNQESVQTTDTEFWLEMIYAMMGSGAGNVGALVLFVLLDTVPGFFESPDFVPPDLVSNPLIVFLLIIPAISVAITLHFFYPQVKEIEVDLKMSILGNMIGVLVHSLFMLPIVINFQREGIAETVSSLAPIGIMTAVLIESLFGVVFYDGSKKWKVKTTREAPGIIFVRSYSF